MFPNKILQKVSKAEILQNTRVDTAVHCLPEWQAPVWVLTGFACYSARKSRSYHAGFRKCSYTCCACYSPFPMLASAISLNGNRRQPPPCLPKSEADGRKSMAAQPFILTIDGVRPFCYSDYTSSNTWSTQAARSISRPIPTPSGIRSSGKIQWRIARFSITPTRRLFR